MNIGKLVSKLRGVVEGRNAPATVAVCAHGKLEMHKEFLDHFPDHSKLAEEYRQWIQTGWESCLAGQNQRQLVPHRLVMSDAKNQNWLVGCIWPSRDRPPDARRYFYSQFIVLPALRDAEWPFIPALCRPLWDALERMYGNLRAVPDAGAWRTLIRSKSIATSLDVPAAGELIFQDLLAAKQITLGDWYPGVGQAYGAPTDFVAELAHRITRMQRSLEEGPSLWRLETNAAYSIEMQLTAWLAWFQANLPRGPSSSTGGKLKQNLDATRFVLLVPKEATAGVVPHLMTRALRADDFCAMAATQSEGSAEPESATAAETAAVTSPAPAAWPDTLGAQQSLADFAEFVVHSS